MQLIGYPKAGQAWQASGVNRYTLINQGLRIGLGAPQGIAGGDITGFQGKGAGAGMGTGHGSATVYRTRVLRRGPRKGQTVRAGVVSKRSGWSGKPSGKVARSTGKGIDSEARKQAELDSWLELGPARAEILASIAAERELSARLQAIGARAAKRQGKRLIELRGVAPSDTSLQDAASDAIAGVLQHVRAWDRVKPQHWQSMRFVRVIALYAGRAAFNSLCSWSRLGMTGDNTGAGTASNWCEFTTDALNELHQGDVRQGQHNPTDARARRAMLRWVFNIGLRQFVASLPADMRGAARASAIAGARRRCRVVGSILMGATVADACFHGGFSSAEAFQNSCKASGFWTALKAARAASLASVPTIAIARGWQHAYAIDAAQASRELQASSGAQAWRDTFDTDTMRATTARGIKATERNLQRRALLANLRESVQWAQYFKAQADKLTRDNLRAFDRIADKLRAGKFDNLHAVTIGKHRRGWFHGLQSS